MIRNFIYIPYYILKTPKKEFWEYVDYLSIKQGKSKLFIVLDVIKCSILHSISFMDYFLLRIFRKTKSERKDYAGTGYMYEYQLKMNPKKYRDIISDKIKFFEHFSPYIGRKWFVLKEFENNEVEIRQLISVSKKIVLKDSKGQAGKEVEVIDVMPYRELYQYMKKNNFDLLEEFVEQHPDIQTLAPRGLNTIRLITQLDKNNEVHIIGTILRMSIHSNTDNLSVGNAAALIDEETGKIARSAVYSDFRKEDIDVHPVSGERIVGFQIPFWKESIDLVIASAKISNGNKSIGWDVAITKKGPILIEGNHNWGRTLWQLPVDKGLKHILDRYDV